MARFFLLLVVVVGILFLLGQLNLVSTEVLLYVALGIIVAVMLTIIVILFKDWRQDRNKEEEDDKPKAGRRKARPKKREPDIREAMTGGGLSLRIGAFVLVLLISVLGAWSGSWWWLLLGIFDVLVFRLLWYPSLITIPITFVGIVEFSERRTGAVLKEGLHEQIPYIYRVKLVTEKVFDNPIAVVVICKDNISVEVSGSLQYRMGARVGDAQGRNRFVEMDETVIRRGIDTAVEQELGFIAEQNDSDAFILSKEVIALFIQCQLMLEILPHKDSVFLGREGVWKPEGYDNTVKKDIPAENRLQFYKENRLLVDELIEAQQETVQNSVIEERYGLDIITFALSKVDFDEDTKRAQQAKKQLDLYERTIHPDLSSDPVGTRMALLGKAEQRNVNIMGLGSALGALGEAIGKGLRGGSGRTGYRPFPTRDQEGEPPTPTGENPEKGA